MTSEDDLDVTIRDVKNPQDRAKEHCTVVLTSGPHQESLDVGQRGGSLFGANRENPPDVDHLKRHTYLSGPNRGCLYQCSVDLTPHWENSWSLFGLYIGSFSSTVNIVTSFPVPGFGPFLCLCYFLITLYHILARFLFRDLSNI